MQTNIDNVSLEELVKLAENPETSPEDLIQIVKHPKVLEHLQEKGGVGLSEAVPTFANLAWYKVYLSAVKKAGISKEILMYILDNTLKYSPFAGSIIEEIFVNNTNEKTSIIESISEEKITKVITYFKVANNFESCINIYKNLLEKNVSSKVLEIIVLSFNIIDNELTGVLKEKLPENAKKIINNILDGYAHGNNKNITPPVLIAIARVCAQVCKSDPEILEKIITNYTNVVNEVVLINLAMNCNKNDTILTKIIAHPKANNKVLETVANYCGGNLNILNEIIRKDKVNDTVLASIVENCNGDKNILNRVMYHSAVSDNSLNMIVEKCGSNLNLFKEIIQHNKVGPNALLNIAKHCLNNEDIFKFIIDHPKIDIKEMQALVEIFSNNLQVLEKIIQHPKAKEVVLQTVAQNCDHNIPLLESIIGKSIETNTLMYVANNCNNDLGIFKKIIEKKEVDNDTLNYIAKNCNKNLEIFKEIIEKKEVDNDTLNYVAKNCNKNLEIFKEIIEKLKDNKILYYVANNCNNDLGIFKKIIEKVVDKDTLQYVVAHCNGDLDIFEKIIEKEEVDSDILEEAAIRCNRSLKIFNKIIEKKAVTEKTLNYIANNSQDNMDIIKRIKTRCTELNYSSSVVNQLIKELEQKKATEQKHKENASDVLISNEKQENQQKKEKEQQQQEIKLKTQEEKLKKEVKKKHRKEYESKLLLLLGKAEHLTAQEKNDISFSLLFFYTELFNESNIDLSRSTLTRMMLNNLVTLLDNNQKFLDLIQKFNEKLNLELENVDLAKVTEQTLDPKVFIDDIWISKILDLLIENPKELSAENINFLISKKFETLILSCIEPQEIQAKLVNIILEYLKKNSKDLEVKQKNDLINLISLKLINILDEDRDLFYKTLKNLEKTLIEIGLIEKREKFDAQLFLLRQLFQYQTAENLTNKELVFLEKFMSGDLEEKADRENLAQFIFSVINAQLDQNKPLTDLQKNVIFKNNLYKKIEFLLDYLSVKNLIPVDKVTLEEEKVIKALIFAEFIRISGMKRDYPNGISTLAAFNEFNSADFFSKHTALLKRLDIADLENWHDIFIKMVLYIIQNDKPQIIELMSEDIFETGFRSERVSKPVAQEIISSSKINEGKKALLTKLSKIETSESVPRIVVWALLNSKGVWPILGLLEISAIKAEFIKKLSPNKIEQALLELLNNTDLLNLITSIRGKSKDEETKIVAEYVLKCRKGIESLCKNLNINIDIDQWCAEVATADLGENTTNLLAEGAISDVSTITPEMGLFLLSNFSILYKITDNILKNINQLNAEQKTFLEKYELIFIAIIEKKLVLESKTINEPGFRTLIKFEKFKQALIKFFVERGTTEFIEKLGLANRHLELIEVLLDIDEIRAGFIGFCQKKLSKNGNEEKFLVNLLNSKYYRPTLNKLTKLLLQLDNKDKIQNTNKAEPGQKTQKENKQKIEKMLEEEIKEILKIEQALKVLENSKEEELKKKKTFKKVPEAETPNKKKDNKNIEEKTKLEEEKKRLQTEEEARKTEEDKKRKEEQELKKRMEEVKRAEEAQRKKEEEENRRKKEATKTQVTPLILSAAHQTITPEQAKLNETLLKGIKEKDLKAVIAALENGADVNSVTDGEYGKYNAIQFAVFMGNTDIVKKLLEKEPNLAHQNHFHETTLDIAQYSINAEEVLPLIEAAEKKHLNKVKRHPI